MVCCFSPRCVLVLLIALATPVASFHSSRGPAGRSALFGRTSYDKHHPRQSKTALHSAALVALDTLFQSHAYAAAAITCGIKASSADLVAQKRQYRMRNETPIKYTMGDSVVVAAPKTTDLRRNIAFLVYGAVYQGLAQEYVYNHLYPAMFGSGTSAVVVLSKVLFDLCIQTTLVTLPIAYLTKALIFKYSAKEAFHRYWDDIKHHGLLKKYFMLWGPVQCITFSIIAEHYRVTFIACVSFFWLIIFSTIASKGPKKEVEEVVEEEHIPECELTDGLTCNIDG